MTPIINYSIQFTEVGDSTYMYTSFDLKHIYTLFIIYIRYLCKLFVLMIYCLFLTPYWGLFRYVSSISMILESTDPYTIDCLSLVDHTMSHQRISLWTWKSTGKPYI